MDLSHVMKINDIEKYCGPVFLGTYVILFNANRISREEAIRIARADSYSPYVLVLPKEQMEGLFYDKPQDDQSTERNPQP